MSAAADRRRLLLYTKPAIAGRVKTRLTSRLTPEEAAAVHAAFVGDLLERLAHGAFDLRVAWALEAGESLPAASPRGIRQEGPDLGERLYHGLDRAAGGTGRVVVAALGSDHPTVPLATLHEAFERVEAGADVVLGPSLDGGYYLIVLAPEAVRRELFEGVDWSTDRVLEQTVERIGLAGLRLEQVEPALDVDTPADLERLAEELEQAEEALCPRTREVLRRMGWMEGDGGDR